MWLMIRQSWFCANKSLPSGNLVRFFCKPTDYNPIADITPFDAVKRDVEEESLEKTDERKLTQNIKYDDIAYRPPTGINHGGRPETYWHNNDLPEKIFPEKWEPQVRLVRTPRFGKHIRAHKEFEFGEIILMQKPHIRMCPIENGVCRRCLREQKPYSPCQRVQSFVFNELQEKARKRMVYDFGPNVLQYWDFIVKFSLLFAENRNYGLHLRLSKGARAIRKPVSILAITQWILHIMPRRISEMFVDFDFEMMVKLLRANQEILRKPYPDALYNQITFFPHHCNPTATVVETDRGATVVCIAPERVNAGEILTLAWVPPIWPRERTQKYMKEEIMMENCYCTVCANKDDLNRVFHCQCDGKKEVYARIDLKHWWCECGEAHNEKFIQDCKVEEYKLKRMVARKNFKPTDFNTMKFLETSLMHPTHHLVYEYTLGQAQYIYDNSMIDHYEFAINTLDLTFECIKQHPSMWYHTNHVDLLTKQAQMAIIIGWIQKAEEALHTAEIILDFFKMPITNYKMRIDGLKEGINEFLAIEEPEAQEKRQAHG